MFENELDLSEDTERQLDELKKRKRKYDNLKASLWLWSTATGVTFLFFSLMFFRYVMVGSKGNATAMLEILVSSRPVLYSLISFIACAAFTRDLLRRIDKAKTKYDNLRAEVIDRLYTSWTKNSKSDVRDQISRQMKKDFDINIIYKS